MKTTDENNISCNQKSGCCEPKSGLARRDFLRLAGISSIALLAPGQMLMAGPFTRKDFEELVPADKKLRPEWVKSLYERGKPEVLRGSELRYVGMPVGGIGCGQLYLGGDGRLLHWDIFNQHISTGAAHYADPFIPDQRVIQRFSIKIGDKSYPLDTSVFPDVTFRGEYPIGIAEYKNPGVPVAIKLEAFSPFIPLQTDDSSLPATILSFTISNTSGAPVEASFIGEMENGVSRNNRWRDGKLRQKTIQESGLTALLFSSEQAEPEERRSDIVFEDWSKGNFNDWKVEGAAFGQSPIKKSDIPDFQMEGGDTSFIISSSASPLNSPEFRTDKSVGKLTSREFTIDRHFIDCWIGGGSGARFGITLFVEDHPVYTIGGNRNKSLVLRHMDVCDFAGKRARIEIVDDNTGGWDSLIVGKITFTDKIDDPTPFEKLPDTGSMALALTGKAGDHLLSKDAAVRFGEKQIGMLGHKFKLAGGESTSINFIVAWHFPNLSLDKPLEKAGRYYATKFPSALEVVRHISSNYDRLVNGTRLWRDTWYDSTLPYWFLDRTMLNTSILATSTCFRFADGRFYGWEGVGCCAGTCGHVYQYAHAAGRLFPELERDARERVDFGLALQPDGAIYFRGEFNKIPAIDGQAGTILRALREHQMSADGSFLKRNWPKIKLATQWLINKDANNDGLIESNQHNTLDTDWFGKVAWLSGLYLASLLGAAKMADDVGDDAFAIQCRTIFAAGQKNLVEQLFDGEYFINKVDPNHLDAINSGTGCEIDQVFGQSWAFQVGLPRVLPQKETLTALKSLWRYNFSPDVGPYRAVFKPGRWYAMAGEAGLLMCTFPRNDWDYDKARGKGYGSPAGYFNECMNGFEYQVAGHMIWEGLVKEGLSVTRAVHDRYHASRRNPWNEVECGDHYARSMASYGVYLAACGFVYHGPDQHIGFAPRLSPENFKCAFTGAEGWGSFTQKIKGKEFTSEISVQLGILKLKTISLQSPSGNNVRVKLGSKSLPAKISKEGDKLLITLNNTVQINKDERLKILIT